MNPISALVVCLAVLASSVQAFSRRAGDAASRETRHVLWSNPGAISEKNLFWGVGSPERAPKPPFTFRAENTTGTKPKIEIVDANGVNWTVKLPGPTVADNEVHAEIAASRLVWAFGFFVDENYFVSDGRIEGVTALKRTTQAIDSDGRFRTARFERRDSGVQFVGPWNLEDNRFKGRRELSALQILTMLLGNWDARPENTETLRLVLPNGDVEQRYFLSDLGTAFGRHGGGLQKHSRWNVDHYRDESFLAGKVLDRLQFKHHLMGSQPISVPIEHAKWFVSLAEQLTPAQIRAAFEASGASPEEIDGFTKEVMKRLAAVRDATSK